MRKTRRLFSIVALMFIMVFALTGCGEETVPIEKEIDTLELTKGTILTQEKEVEGIKFTSIYDTDRYDFSTWRITDSKVLNMELKAENIPDGTEIIVEHMHVSISLKAEYPQVDGMKQAEMDDSFHGSGQDGFIINDKYSYKNIFEIDGYSETLLKGWGYYTGEYGACTISERRLTERNLIEYHKVYANKVIIVYDVMIKHQGEEDFHTVPIKDEFLISVKIPEDVETK